MQVAANFFELSDLQPLSPSFSFFFFFFFFFFWFLSFSIWKQIIKNNENTEELHESEKKILREEITYLQRELNRYTSKESSGNSNNNYNNRNSISNNSNNDTTTNRKDTSNRGVSARARELSTEEGRSRMDEEDEGSKEGQMETSTQSNQVWIQTY